MTQKLRRYVLGSTLLVSLVGCQPLEKVINPTHMISKTHGILHLKIDLPIARSLRTQAIIDIVKIRVHVYDNAGDEIEDSPILFDPVPAGGAGTYDFPVPPGTNYSIKVEGLNSSDGVEGTIYGYIPSVVAGEGQTVPVNCDRTPTGKVLNTLAAGDTTAQAHAEALDTSELYTEINSDIVTQAKAPDAEAIASAVRSQGVPGDVPSDLSSYYLQDVLGETLEVTTGDAYASYVIEMAGRTSNGDYVLVWENYYSPTADYSLQAQRFDSTGAQIGGPIRLTTLTDSQAHVEVEYSASADNYMIVWQKNSAEIKARSLNPATGALGSEVVLSNTPGDAEPEIAANGNGGYLVAWTRAASGADWGLHTLPINSSGGVLGSDIKVTSGLGNGYASLAYNSTNDHFLMTFQDGVAMGGLRIATDGSAIGSEMPITTQDIYGRDHDSVYNSINQEYLVVWTRNQYPSYDLYAARVPTNLGSVPTPISVNSDTDSQERPDLAFNHEDNEYLVTWNDVSDVRAQKLNSTGGLLGPKINVTTAIISSQDFPATIYNATSNEYVLMWRPLNQRFVHTTSTASPPDCPN